MRRIKNSPELKAQVTAFNHTIFSKRRPDFILPVEKLETLRKTRKKKEKYGIPAIEITKYIQKIENEYLRIINADESEMKKLIKEFEKIIKFKDVKASKALHEDIVKAMRYDDLREVEFPDLLRKMNIKSCVYCHSQSTLVIKKHGKTHWSALLELDHKFPKSEYPFLCTSFYNLYPVCGNCNLSKSSKPTKFQLYTDTNELDLLSFGLTKISIAKYWQTKKAEDLKITINPINTTDEYLEQYQKMFNISKIYEHHRDIAEELVHKLEVYNKAYKNTLVGSFKKLFPDPSLINRLLIGNYEKPTEMLKRPMAKFVQEIARDINLIPKETED
jgi:5-methylcytosine-specific restriction endonuclease McrA